MNSALTDGFGSVAGRADPEAAAAAAGAAPSFDREAPVVTPGFGFLATGGGGDLGFLNSAEGFFTSDSFSSALLSSSTRARNAVDLLSNAKTGFTKNRDATLQGHHFEMGTQN